MDRKKAAIVSKATADYYRDEILKEWILKSDPLEEQSTLCFDLIIEAIQI